MPQPPASITSSAAPALQDIVPTIKARHASKATPDRPRGGQVLSGHARCVHRIRDEPQARTPLGKVSPPIPAPKGPRGRCWANVTGKVVPDPAFIPASWRELLERMPGKSKRLEQPLEFVRTLCARGTAVHLATSSEQHGMLSIPASIETAQSFAKHGVTDVAASIQDDGACPFICGIRLQRQFKG